MRPASDAAAVPVQDDSREREMISLFNLTVPPDRGRSDVDAYLKVSGVKDPLPFELKSTTGNSVSTVRDLGPEHFAKWRDLHWIFAFYDDSAGRPKLNYCYYASPSDMRGWIEGRANYIRPDMVLAEHAPELIGDPILTEILGDASDFSIEDARLVMKQQWRAAEYRENADLAANRYSRERMVALLRERLSYVIRRGSTLNNPHIPERYLEDAGLERVTEDHAAKLRTLVTAYLDSEEKPAALDPAIEGQASASDSDDATA